MTIGNPHPPGVHSILIAKFFAGIAILAGFLAMAGPPLPTMAPVADFYVATVGRDTWSGKLPIPNRSLSDGPFATIARAQQAVRDLKVQQPGRTRRIMVAIASGTYHLSAPLVFTPEDSGTATAPVMYLGYGPSSPPVISGGARVMGLEEQPDGSWRATLPDVAEGTWRFNQLFVNGERRTRPRLPKNGYYSVAAALPASPEFEGHGYDRFQYEDGDISAAWSNLGDVEVLAFHIFTITRFRIESVDEAQRAVTFTGPTAGVSEACTMVEGDRYIVENVSEALTSPGEWYVDNTTGVLTYLPMDGEDVYTATVIAPRLEQLLVLDGDPEAGRYVENITFQGLAFAHGNWVTPPEGYAGRQAVYELPAAVTATAARNVTFTRCTVKQVGAYAVELGASCTDNVFQDSDLTDLGAGGVKIGETRTYVGASLTARNTLRHCSITHGGRLHPGAVGIWIGQSPNNLIEHNEIWDFYYTGLSLGWTWGYGTSLCFSNTVAYNKVHLLGQRVLSDIGGIYAIGVSPGTVIHNNHFYDIDCYHYGGWGIYMDGGASEIVAASNLVYNTRDGSYHHHYGENNKFINNILAFDPVRQVLFDRPEDHLSFTFQRNIAYYKQGGLFGGDWTWLGGNYALDYNCYYDLRGGPTGFAGLTLEQWRTERGQDIHSVVANPLFVDAANHNFNLQPGSPALAAGFKPFDLTAAGRTTPVRDPLTLATVPRAWPELPPRPLADDFEDTAVGGKPNGVTIFEEYPMIVRVTDEAAAAGSRSLKFLDGPNQTYSFNPHIWYIPELVLSEGYLAGSFEWLIQTPSQTPPSGSYAFHEWRDWPAGGSYYTGPSLWLKTDGYAYGNGNTKLFQFPLGTWMHFDVICATGEAATGTWTLIVSWPGLAAPLRFDNLPCSPNFRVMNWYGWSSMATWDQVSYLDNLNLRQVEAP